MFIQTQQGGFIVTENIKFFHIQQVDTCEEKYYFNVCADSIILGTYAVKNPSEIYIIYNNLIATIMRCSSNHKKVFFTMPSNKETTLKEHWIEELTQEVIQ